LGVKDELKIISLQKKNLIFMRAYLCNDEFSFLRRIKHELLGDVHQGDARVRQSNGSDGSLDNIVPETQNQSVCVISLEKKSIASKYILKPLKIAQTNG